MFTRTTEKRLERYNAGIPNSVLVSEKKSVRIAKVGILYSFCFIISWIWVVISVLCNIFAGDTIGSFRHIDFFHDFFSTLQGFFYAIVYAYRQDSKLFKKLWNNVTTKLRCLQSVNTNNDNTAEVNENN